MHRQHDDLYERALRDPDFLEDVRSHHAGSWDVLDALWWASHPLDAAPSGAAAPLAQVRALQRRVFAADADVVGDHGVHGELQRLQAQVAREAGAIDAAALAAHTDAGAALADAGAARAVKREAAGADDTDAGGPADATGVGAGFKTGLDAPAPAGIGRRRILLTAGLTAAVLLGALGGSRLSDPTLFGAAPAPSAASTPPPLALTVFQREQMPEDLPAVPLPAEFDTSTVRALGSMGAVDADPAFTTYYYTVRTTSSLVCLIVLPPAASLLSTCTLEPEFPSTGLRLYWQAQGIFADTGAATGPVTSFLTWRPDGSVEVGAVG
ncbi:hypothetical protein [Cryobacterium sp. SO1]|uniref:hypothetical protein n=1 Tax=Cryobacterium sp. SO1 TaxID=1897061 RepID=UPI0010233A37|nr:hypothetical protein [Cryobacterium sp. SO1]RZI36767.1 hypothetical protein BJQ95_00819 [Cryobacterium sp. SO1]